LRSGGNPSVGIPGVLASPRTGPVEVREVATGVIRARFTAGAPVARIAFDGRTVVAATDAGTIVAWDVISRRTLVRHAVPDRRVRGLDVSAGHVVFNVGRLIYVLDLRTGAERVVATAASPPVGRLSFERDTITWAENRWGVDRIRTIRIT
jgi:hypothetical protein